MYIAINGYGVPKDINTDLNYNSYLGQVFNYLWERYRGKKLVLILCGGNTDMAPPYRKTEAGEMAKWFAPRIKKLHLSRWRIRLCDTTLSSVDNLLACRRIVGSNALLHFCEKTHEGKVGVLARAVFGKQATVIPVEFNLSPARYDLDARKQADRDDLRYSLRALKDPVFRKKLHAANQEKVRVLRTTPPSRRDAEVDRIARRVRRKFIHSN